MLKCFKRQVSNPNSLKRKKIVVVGDGKCGKTCLIQRFISGRFTDTLYESTLFEAESVMTHHENKPVELVICDTAGQEDYSRIRPLSYTGCDVIIICFSVDHPDSMENVTASWFPEISHYCEGVPILLVGTKTDLRDENIQSCNHSMVDTIDKMLKNADKFADFDQGQTVANMIGAVGYMECSAKQDTGVQRIFKEATKIALLTKRKKRRW